jgi:hypothetical protein
VKIAYSSIYQLNNMVYPFSEPLLFYCQILQIPPGFFQISFAMLESVASIVKLYLIILDELA